MPVLSGIARGFATFDHWHCDVPSQTFTDQMNRIYTVSGHGTYNINDGSMRITYSLSQNGSTYTDSGIQIYTRN